MLVFARYVQKDVRII